MTAKQPEQIAEEKEARAAELRAFCGPDSCKAAHSYWLRVFTSASKSNVIEELRRLRKLEVTNELLQADREYYHELQKAVKAEFRAQDKRIRAQKLIGNRNRADKTARDHRMILLGVCLDYLMAEDSDLRKRVFCHLDKFLTRDVDRQAFSELTPPLSLEDDFVSFD